jgi:hypothetical protein
MYGVIIQILIAFVNSFGARLLLGAGFAVFTYDFVDDLVLQAQSEMQVLLGSLPSDILGLISLLKIPQSLSVVMSALAIAAFIKSAKVFLGKS